MQIYQPEEERETRRYYHQPGYLKITPNMFAAGFTCVGLSVVLVIILACMNGWWGLHW